MYDIGKISEKLNRSSEDNVSQRITLSDIMGRSLAEVNELTGNNLNWGEKVFLYQQAQKELKENRMTESRILSRANPQLANAVHLGISQLFMRHSYDEFFGGRASKFVNPGSVTSMFSPAGYLTELYREAKNLHVTTSEYHLDNRRADLASLSLSQSNMDEELSTLSLSNELLLNSIQKQGNLDYDGVMEMLSTYRLTGMTPFHLSYEASRQAILLQDEEFTSFRNNPDIAALMDITSMLAIKNDISPELYNILTETITEANAEELIIKNFGENTDTDIFRNIDYLARYYGLTYEEISSLLGMMTIRSDIIAGRQYYRNNQLVTFSERDGSLNAVVLNRTGKANYKQFGYAELIPVPGHEDIYQFQFTVTTGPVDNVSIGSTGRPGGNDLLSGGKLPGLNKPFSININLGQEALASGVTIGVTRYLPDGRFYWASVSFQQRIYPYPVFLLNINKLIRLYKATSIPVSDIRTIIANNSDDLIITDNVLSQLFWVQYYMQLYSIDVSAALVLSGSDISTTRQDDQPDTFTRLFNTPQLNGLIFYADGSTIRLNPSDITDSFRTGVIKRAFQINDTELYTLWSLAQGNRTPSDFTCTVRNLSVLYRIKLLADVHGLSVTELSMLLSVSPYATARIIDFSESELSGQVNFIRMYTQWLTAQSWTVSDLYLMTTDYYNTVLSPDIENLVTTLKDGLASQDLSQLDDPDLILAAAPFISAAIQLDSAELATAVLQWLDQLKPLGLTVKAFLALINSDPLTTEEETRLVSFCQIMGQLALIVRGLRLTPGEMSLAVTLPGKFVSGTQYLPHDIATVRMLSRFHHWMQQCGTSATEILSALSKSTLTPLQLAQSMALDEQTVIQGLAQYDSNASVFSNWMAIDTTLQWVDIACTLNITPSGVGRLIHLKYTDPTHQPLYSDWVAISHTLQSGLSSRQSVQLQATLDEALSSALCAYTIKNNKLSRVTTREQLYKWLLLDNQVSAQVKTTRLAEAISSIQLYVNLALSGLEEGILNSVKSRPFFANWDTYNKRYSTWAGLSQLLYYPENYVDPTLRIGQTGMMNEMLQMLSQSQLDNDSVEVAFKTYMTRFEEIANLEIISGYHDSTSVHSGSTYLIGKSSIGDYYWRTVDTGKMVDGKLPANAWSEWKRISTAAVPVSNLIRPVIFQSRLYIFWVESRETSTTGSSPTKSVEYMLKYAHILHDGTWSVPSTNALESNVLPRITSPRLYCSQHQTENNVLAIIYDAVNEGSEIPDISFGIQIGSAGDVNYINDLTSILRFIRVQLDTKSKIMMNTPYLSGGLDDIFVTIETSTNVNVPSYPNELVNYYNVYFNDVKANILYTEGKVELNIPSTNLIRISSFGGRQGALIKQIGSAGDKFYLSGKKEIIPTDNAFMQCVVSNKGAFVQTTVKSFSQSGYINGSSYGAGTFAGSGEGGSNITKIGSGISSAPKDVELRCYPGDGTYRHIFTDFNKKMDYSINLSNFGMQFLYNDIYSPAYYATKIDEFTLERASLSFDKTTLNIPLDDFSSSEDGSVTVAIYCGFDYQGYFWGTLSELKLRRIIENKLPVIPLVRITNGTQYLQYSVYRIRVNTLFAKSLVARASMGVGAVLSMETQQLPEPQLGKGFYVDFILPPYNESVHGNSRAFTLRLRYDADDMAFVVHSGMLSDRELSVRLFIPDDDRPHPNDFLVKVYLTTNNLGDGVWVGAHFKYKDNTQSTVILHASSNISMFSNVFILNSQKTEPMDFNGANALYFWEMFYYVPMMVFKRLLQESNFIGATQWIKYIWSPEGYLNNGQLTPYQWNVRPLEEDTSWNANPLDSVDPDAVAQADPMHYKVATFMGMLDLLIARGDAAYRQLERDSLNEAKMWYMQALHILGDEPYLPETADWTNPTLSEAADQTLQSLSWQMLEIVRLQTVEHETYSANSLTGLFMPQQNEKLKSYWQTLALRLYNLRHNLSIDGQPLSLPVYATPADPSSLLSAVVNASQGSSMLPGAAMPLYRFPLMLDNAQRMVSQLTQFGNALLSISERQDAEALSELLQTQGSELVLQSIALQEKTISEIDADKTVLEQSLVGARMRLDNYAALYDEDVSTIEKRVMDLYTSSSSIAAGGNALFMAGAALDMVPNIYGMATGGARFGALSNSLAIGTRIASDATHIAAERLGQSEAYRRRRQEWEIQRNTAESEVKQIDASLNVLTIRREAAVLQKSYLETQQNQVQAQLAFLQNKFTSKALYNWLRGKLAAIYYQFYDMAVSRCLMAQEAYKWRLGIDSAVFIRPGAWLGTYAGLMSGETLMLNLAQMEQAYLQKDQREKEVTRTVCLSEIYARLVGSDKFSLTDKITEFIYVGTGSAGTDENGLKVENNQLLATLKLSDLNIRDDYPDTLGNIRRIKQISVTLPALVGPYQDVRAILSYGGSVMLPQGCNAIVVSHGMNDSGLFQLDFNDPRYLPFEGIPVDDSGSLTLNFPDMSDKQKDILLSLTDIILHIHYTILG